MDCIIHSFSNYFREHILETGETVKLSGGLGEFTIQKKKSVKIAIINGEPKVALSVDWKKTKEKGKKIYNFNYDTDGYRFRWLWIKRNAMFRNKDFWYFKPSRTTSRLLTHYLRVDNSYQHKYSEWSKFLDKNDVR